MFQHRSTDLLLKNSPNTPNVSDDIPKVPGVYWRVCLSDMHQTKSTTRSSNRHGLKRSIILNRVSLEMGRTAFYPYR